MNGSNFGHNLAEPDCRANNSVHDFNTIVSSDSNVSGTESWREEFEKRIKAKDAEEEKKCAELMETGKKVIFQIIGFFFDNLLHCVLSIFFGS